MGLLGEVSLIGAPDTGKRPRFWVTWGNLMNVTATSKHTDTCFFNLQVMSTLLCRPTWSIPFVASEQQCDWADLGVSAVQCSSGEKWPILQLCLNKEPCGLKCYRRDLSDTETCHSNKFNLDVRTPTSKNQLPFRLIHFLFSFLFPRSAQIKRTLPRYCTFCRDLVWTRNLKMCLVLTTTPALWESTPFLTERKLQNTK